MATATATATTSELRQQQVHDLWVAGKANRTELGRLLYDERNERLSVGGAGNRDGFHEWLRGAGIPKQSAYRRIREYEISIGVCEPEDAYDKPVPNGTASVPVPVIQGSMSEPDIEPIEPSFEVESSEDFSDLPTNPIPDPVEIVAPVEPVVEPVVELVESVTTQLRKLFKGDIVIKPSNAKSGLQSCQGKYDVYGLTEKQVRKIAKVLR